MTVDKPVEREGPYGPPLDSLVSWPWKQSHLLQLFTKTVFAGTRSHVETLSSFHARPGWWDIVQRTRYVQNLEEIRKVSLQTSVPMQILATSSCNRLVR